VVEELGDSRELVTRIAGAGTGLQVAGLGTVIVDKVGMEALAVGQPVGSAEVP
jgi:hypothetical protein